MVDLVIPEDFCQNDVKPVGKTSHSDGENKHFIWGKGDPNGKAFSNEDVKAAYEEHGEKMVPLGIHGTTVAVHFHFHQEGFEFLFTFCRKGGVICTSEVIDISPGNPDSSLEPGMLGL